MVLTCATPELAPAASGAAPEIPPPETREAGGASPGDACQTMDDPARLDAKALDKLWEVWWRHPILGDVSTPEPPRKRRLSLRHGTKRAEISDYIQRLCAVLTHQMVGRHSTWVPSTPDMEEWYTAMKVLGQGHYGTVQLCEEKGTGQRFACKTILKSSLEVWHMVTRSIEQN